MKRLGNIFKGDVGIWVIFVLLTLISLVAVYTTIGRVAIVSGHSPLSSWGKHVVFVVLAYIIVIICSNLNYRHFAKFSRIVFYISIALLVYVLAFCESRWIAIPGLGTFQPSELTKVALIAMLANMLAVNKDQLDDLAFYLKMMLAIGVAAILILPENLSTAALLVLVCMVELWFGGINRKYWGLTMCAFLVVGAIGIGIAVGSYDKTGSSTGMLDRSSTWGHRVDSWLHPNPDELSQENMARMAIASGGLTGVGVGNTVHARLMTQAENDFIYAIILEESGLWLGIVIFLLYSWFYFRCLRMARRCKGMFGSLVLVGYGTLIYYQALINMAVAVGAMPVTGQTLPLVSNGGTAYLCMAIAVGVIQSVCYDTMKSERDVIDKRRDDRAFEEVVNLSEKVNSATA